MFLELSNLLVSNRIPRCVNRGASFISVPFTRYWKGLLTFLEYQVLQALGKQCCQEWKRHRGWWGGGRERRRRRWWWHDSDCQVSLTRWAGSCGQRSPGGGNPVACRPARKCHQGARVILLLCHKMWFTICLVRIRKDEVPLFHVAELLILLIFIAEAP